MATVVQTKRLSVLSLLSSTPTDLIFEAPTVAGNAIIVGVAVGAANGGTIGVADATNGTYAAQVYHERTGSSVAAALNWFRNAASIQTVSVTSSNSGNGIIFMWEVNGLDPAATVLSGGNDDGSTMNHTTSSTPLSQTNGFTVCVSMLGAGNGPSVGVGYTELASPNTARFAQYRTTTIAANQGDYTTSSNDAQAGVMASFADLAGVMLDLNVVIGEPTIGGSLL